MRIAPSAGITPQVRRVSAGSTGAISAGLRQPPCLSFARSMLPAMGTRPLPMLRGERVVLRPAREADAVALVAMLREPSVQPWWGDWDAARVRADLIAAQDDEAVLALEGGGEGAGILLLSEEELPQYRPAS